MISVLPQTSTYNCNGHHCKKMADLAAAVGLVGVAHVLQVIRCDLTIDRQNTMEAGLAQFEDFRYLVEKGLCDTADKFGKRTQAAGRIVFGLVRTKKLVGVMHWVQDCFRASDVPNHDNFDDDVLFEALSLAQIRKSDVELVTTYTKAVDPRKFKDEHKWPKWEKAFTNYLSVVPGVSGIPLSYVVQEQEVPTPGMEYPGTLTERMINRAPLEGQYYIADTQRVHNLLVGFLQGENTKNWIRNIARYQYGWRDIIFPCVATMLAKGTPLGGLRTRSVLRQPSIIKQRGLCHDSLQRMFAIFEEETNRLQKEQRSTNCRQRFRTRHSPQP